MGILYNLKIVSPTLWVAFASGQLLLGNLTCPGTVDVSGYGPVYLVNAYWNVPNDRAGFVTVDDGKVRPFLKGRTYFANTCNVGSYNHSDYIALKLLGKRLRYTSDLSGAGCGCNAAVYLTSLQQNSAVSGCDDYYCDANNVCGVRCAEIDIQEANLYGYHATLHLPEDGNGVGVGYGGGDWNWNGNRDWSREDYGPNGRCIKTTKPYEVSVDFPVNADGSLQAYRITLSQEGSPCTLTAMIWSYEYHHRQGLQELTQALKEGMTPIVSYWNSTSMIWLDGKGQDGRGPCDSHWNDDLPYGISCGDSVRFYNWSVEAIPDHFV